MNPAYLSRSNSPEDFWNRVDIRGDEECWEWKGKPHHNGYGQFSMRGVKKDAHKYAWELTHGEIPTGLFVCHDCPGGDNKMCCNPHHLFLGTHKENMQDAKRKGRIKKGDSHYTRLHPEKRCTGERNGMTKLDVWKVVGIVALSCQGLGPRKISSICGVRESHVSRILRGQRWKALTGL